ncbi:MAG TPA: DUF3800 domain-containing protein [Aestuariivirga sp.]|nr:DUF3800 domain-containing protein [Aestuariivirga sp.]
MNEVAETVNFYLDDSGTRHPNRKPGKRAAHGYDWFALGGILIRDVDEETARRLHSDFVAKWEITTPLHSAEIRGKNLGFLWLRDLEKSKLESFYEELYCMMRDCPVIGLAAVIDRAGYNTRYSEKYDGNPWMLCKTAFAVAVERASKYAIAANCKLRVNPERCNKAEDAKLKSYYEDLINNGVPFPKGGDAKYAALSPEEFRSTLYDFKLKAKSSPMAQLADLYLWPVCMGGYHKGNRPYRRLFEDGKLIECVLSPDQHDERATKYSCFDKTEEPKNTKGPD